MRFSPFKNERHLEILLIGIAVVLGALHAWVGRYTMNPDGISYLDIGDAFWRGDLAMAVNAYWSPLYAWLIGFALYIIRPSLYGEFAAVHLVNFFIFAGALFAFRFFLHSLIAFLARYRDDDEKEGVERLSPPMLMMIGYGLFLITSLNFITLASVSPDLLVSMFMFVVGGVLLSLHRGRNGQNVSVGLYIALGVGLGLGYLAKAVVFPLAFVIIFVAFWTQKISWKHAGGIAVACSIFFLISAPWIMAISRAKGILTFGESGKLTYAWHVNGVRLHTHWQGEERIFGAPIHPSRVISARPPAYEFRGSVGGTYPPWYDPSYWYEGVRPRFTVSNQLSALSRNARILYETLLVFQIWSVVIGFMMMTFLWRHALRLREVLHMSILFVPAAVGIGAYLLVLVQPRYVAPFAVFFFFAWASLIRVPRDIFGKGVASSVTAIITIMFAFPLVVSTSTKFVGEHIHEHAQVAEELMRMGIHAGDPVAIIGWQFDGSAVYWARLARVRIVAEATPTLENFWMTKSAVQYEILKAFRDIGAKAVVTEGGLPSYADISGWEPLGSTGRYVFLLDGNNFLPLISATSP